MMLLGMEVMETRTRFRCCCQVKRVSCRKRDCNFVMGTLLQPLLDKLNHAETGIAESISDTH